MIASLLEYAYLQNAFISAFLASIVCGIIGTIVIEKKIVMMSGGIAHTSFGGIGLAHFFQFPPLLGAFGIASLAAVAIAAINRKTTSSPDLFIALFWSMGMAIGLIFIAWAPGYPPDLTTFMFGNILAVGRSDLYFMALLTGIVIFIVGGYLETIKAHVFDEDFLASKGFNIIRLDYLIYLLTAFAVVILIRVVGFILIIALLTAPAATAKQITSRFGRMMLYAIGFGMLYSCIGLWVSYTWNVPSGASIILVSGISYLTFTYIHPLIKAKSEPFRNQASRSDT